MSMIKRIEFKYKDKRIFLSRLKANTDFFKNQIYNKASYYLSKCLS